MEIDITALLAVSDDESPDLTGLLEAVEAASSQDQTAWLTDKGQRIAAIVPVDVAEYHDEMTRRVLTTPAGPRVKFPEVTVQLSGGDGSTGVIMAKVADAMGAAGVDRRDIRSFREGILACESYEAVLALAQRTVNVE
jgi:hypothetical protein